ncbi:hypothetical protein M8J77_023180 [Diaphorina citri]|nr:hypothetical protein M8J77_023180 [Diaphorina citri]
MSDLFQFPRPSFCFRQGPIRGHIPRLGVPSVRIKQCVPFPLFQCRICFNSLVPLSVSDKAPSEATFRGLEFLVYDQTRIGGEPIISSQDTISLYFRTKHSTGLILHAGDGSDYLNVAIKDGGVAINLKLAMGKLDMYIRPNRLRFDDNQWHHLSIHRRIQEVSYY